MLEEQAHGDPVVEEAIWQERAKRGIAPHKPIETIRITWDQAQKLILLGAIRETFENLNLSVVLTAHSGRKYRAQQPQSDSLSRAIAVVDPCGVYISRVLE